MAERIETPVVTIPAGTTIVAPQTTSLTWLDGVVERIEVRIPPGPSGRVGFRIVHSGQQVIPFQDGQWIIDDDRTLNWPIERFPTGGKWAVQAYNLGIYEHSLHFRFFLQELRTAALAPVTPLAIVQLSPANTEE